MLCGHIKLKIVLKVIWSSANTLQIYLDGPPGGPGDQSNINLYTCVAKKTALKG
jgi:hypothetical protein